jgi:hypothetical protein
MSVETAKPEGSPVDALVRVLDASAALLASPRAERLGLPDDELHREILLPLLPAMIGDEALREFWLERGATGFLGRLSVCLERDGTAPRWEAGDFEIHVTASYRAGADARALADTLLSEDSLRGLAAEVMNRVLDVVWLELPRAAVALPATPEIALAEDELLLVPEIEEIEEMAEPAKAPVEAGPAEAVKVNMVEPLGAPLPEEGSAQPRARTPRVPWRIWARWPQWKRVTWSKKWRGANLPKLSKQAKRRLAPFKFDWPGKPTKKAAKAHIARGSLLPRRIRPGARRGTWAVH